jgi:CBS domain-containing protein
MGALFLGRFSCAKTLLIAGIPATVRAEVLRGGPAVSPLRETLHNVSITASFIAFECGHGRDFPVDNWHNVYQPAQDETRPAAHLKEVAMQVGDILRKKTARVATVRMNETVGIAAQLMRASNISALVVKDVVRTEGNTAVGMFTERDVVRAIAEHGAAGVNLKVSQLISVQQLVSCSSTDTLEHVRHLMNKNHIRHLPVIDDYSLIGVISIRDISTAFDDAATAAAA